MTKSYWIHLLYFVRLAYAGYGFLYEIEKGPPLPHGRKGCGPELTLCSEQEVDIISPKLGLRKRESKNKWACILIEKSLVQRNTSLWYKWERPETGVSSAPTEQKGKQEVSNPNGPMRSHSTSVNPTIAIQQEQQNHLAILLSEMALSW